MTKRREFLKTTPLAIGSALAAESALAKLTLAGESGRNEKGEYVLPPLPYAYNSLEPHIDEQTMQLHHDKHHLAYVNGLNSALKALAAARESGDYNLVQYYTGQIAFHGSGHILHAIFWNNMSPDKQSGPSGDLAKAIDRDFGNFEKFKAHFSAAANKVEGSGWAVLAYEPLGKQLVVLQAEKHQNLTQWGVLPLLVLDVWEHAYYLKYQNRRADYVNAFFNVINWKNVAERYVQASKV